MADLLANTLLYSRAHHLPQMLIGYAAATAIACWAGSGDIVLPAANSRGWSEMASVAATTIPFAAFAAGSLHSSMGSLEQAATQRLVRAEVVHVVLSLLLAATLISTVTVVAGSVGGAVEAIRNLALYAGLALVSGRLFGRSLSWILPIADFVIVDFWGGRRGSPPLVGLAVPGLRQRLVLDRGGCRTGRWPGRPDTPTPNIRTDDHQVQLIYVDCVR